MPVPEAPRCPWCRSRNVEQTGPAVAEVLDIPMAQGVIRKTVAYNAEHICDHGHGFDWQVPKPVSGDA